MSLGLAAACVLGTVPAQDPYSILSASAFDVYVQPSAFPTAGDVDGDGDPDLVIPSVLGREQLFLNDGDGNYRSVTATHLPALARRTQAATLVDVDGDGDLDLALAPSTQFPSVGEQNRLLLNDGSGRFTDVTATQLPVDQDKTVAIAAMDVDGDGDRDLLCVNADLSSSLSGVNRLYRNDGTGHFTDVTATQLPVDPGNGAEVRVGDLDADGDMDFVVALGFPEVARSLRVYLNDGTGRFAPIAPSRFPSFSVGARSLQLEDIDGDLDLDIVVQLDQVRLTAFVNDGTARFADESSLRMPAGNSSPRLAGDFDRDGDVDFTVVGGGVARLLVNDGRGFFAFGAPLSKNCDLAVDVDADQDLDLVGTVTPDVLLNDGRGAFYDRQIAESRGPVVAWAPSRAALADIDGDGDLDAWLTSIAADAGLLLRNDGRGVFVDATPVAIPSQRGSSAVALGDVDGDGDLDAFLSDVGGVRGTRLLMGDGVGGFTDESSTRMPLVGRMTVDLELVDVDGDADLDLIECNQRQPSVLMRNDGRGVFTIDVTGALPSQARNSRAIAAVDIDGDRDLDLVFGNGGEPTRLLLNDGRGVFQDVGSARLPQDAIPASDLATLDVDGDSDVDLVLIGESNVARLFLNDGTGRFANATLGRLPSDLRGQLVHALDHDDDGDVDLITTDPTSVTVWDNDGQGRFALAQRMFAVGKAVVAGDLDLDGDGDLLLVSAGDPLQVATNLRRQLHFGRLVRIGRDLRIDTYLVGRGASAAAATNLLAVGEGRLSIPGLGVFLLDPQSTVVLPGIAFAPGQAVGEFTLGVPAQPALVGGVLHAQSLIFEGARVRLSNAQRVEIVH